jgi:dienelactone hydrolase
MQSPPPRITSLTAADYNARLSASATGQSLLTLSTGSATGSVPCGVDVQYLKYGTVGGKAEATTASAALMVPTGTDAKCTGARPIVLFAHGTTVEKRYNLADFTDQTNPAYGQAQLLASLFAAQGYIVVAPNYAGYDSSSLSYHPFLVADQQSKDMIDALAAAKAALPTLISGTTASTKLFITGYSQGGHVAMATHKALQDAGVAVTASAPMSGPYALGLYGDAVVGGKVPAGSTTLIPMLITSYQKTYGTLYTAPTDYYESTYAAGMEAAFPGSYTSTTLVTGGVVPQLTLFNSTEPTNFVGAGVTPPTSTDPDPATAAGQNALWKAGFGTTNLITNSFRNAYLLDAAVKNPSTAGGTVAPATPAHPLRIAAKANDFRSWTGPTTAPMLLCGGSSDPTVYYSANTSIMMALWAAKVPLGLVRELDVGSSTARTDAFEGARLGFTTALKKVQTDAATAAATAGGDATAQATAAGQATLAYYHSGVAPYCTAAARGFFSNF